MPIYSGGGGGGGFSSAATCELVLETAPQSIADATTTNVLWAVSGSDGIGVTYGANHGLLRIPAGFYLVAAYLFWALNPTGVRAAEFARIGNNNPVGSVFPGVAVSAAAYAVMDDMDGLTLGPFLVKTDAYNPGLGYNFRLSVIQTSGGPLNLTAADIAFARLT